MHLPNDFAYVLDVKDGQAYVIHTDGRLAWHKAESPNRKEAREIIPGDIVRTYPGSVSRRSTKPRQSYCTFAETWGNNSSLVICALLDLGYEHLHKVKLAAPRGMPQVVGSNKSAEFAENSAGDEG